MVGKLVPISVLKDCGMVVYQDDVDRMDIKVHEGDDGIKRVAWSSVQRLAKYHWPYGGVGHEQVSESYLDQGEIWQGA